MAVCMEVPLHLVIHPHVRRACRRITALTCLAMVSGTGVAFASCPAQSVSTPFSQWGDTNSYFLIPGGSFEGTRDEVGWRLTAAILTPGNEPFYVNGSTDSQLLTINGGGSATSPYFCVDNTMSSLRFFANQLAAGSDLQVDALVQTPTGVRTVSVADLADGSMSSWAPTQPITGGGGLQNGASVMVALRFSAPAAAGAWQVDDIYVDPYRSG
jgi:hypothetical protein